jgi:hypothetical protein
MGTHIDLTSNLKLKVTGDQDGDTCYAIIAPNTLQEITSIIMTYVAKKLLLKPGMNRQQE